MSTHNPNPILERIAVQRESLLDCDIVVDDARSALTAAIRQRTQVEAALKQAIAAVTEARGDWVAVHEGAAR